ncbi:hypothetical protein [Thermaerobacter subterraneus]|uniref:Uncharacterized protein n=1 Tax=Thermaerobacter subterraneus DSM 13965 TaxID=867903 RepID=K6P3S7_9FIRM|nr:hypothetical protein [Thermaerobacter subterraneus]EKP95705.1 hypothetical protein ThesuDRAFT_01464 [Thermaerobacter subterraneus DSM 13965]
MTSNAHPQPRPGAGPEVRTVTGTAAPDPEPAGARPAGASGTPGAPPDGAPSTAPPVAATPAGPPGGRPGSTPRGEDSGLNLAGTGPLAPWSLLPRTWLEPAGGRPGPWRREEALAPRPLTPYSAALWRQELPDLTGRISRDLSLPSAGVDLTVDEQGHLLARPLPAAAWPGALAWRAARHGWIAARQAAELVRWWDEQGARTLLADAGELRLRVIPLERAGGTPGGPGGPGRLQEWRRTLERCRDIWRAHLDRLLRLEALATLSLWQLDALLQAFQLPGAPRAGDLVPVPAVVAEMGQRLWHLAARGREAGAVAAVFREPPYHPRLSRLAQDAPGAGAGASPEHGGPVAAFLELWGQFLERYGYVALPAAELAEPTWAEDPEPALAWLARFFQDRGLSPIAAEINAQRRQQQLEEAIRRHLARRPLDRGRIEETRRLAEATTRVAAEMGYHMLVLRSWWRRAVLGAGRDLAAAGRLEEPAAVWQLAPHELEALLGGGPGGGQASSHGPATATAGRHPEGPGAPAGTPGQAGPAGAAPAARLEGHDGAAAPAGGHPGKGRGGDRHEHEQPDEGRHELPGRGGPAQPGGGRHEQRTEPPAPPDEERLERARQRAHRFFRYAGMAYFALLALIPLIMARQGLLWWGLREMALLVVEIVVVLAPLAAVAGAAYLLARGRKGRPRARTRDEQAGGAGGAAGPGQPG